MPVTLASEQITKAERWQDRHDCQSFSEAVRQMIDLAHQVDGPA